MITSFLEICLGRLQVQGVTSCKVRVGTELCLLYHRLIMMSRRSLSLG